MLNSILGEKIAITTDKPQTTRNSIRGIYTRFDEEGETDGVQMVFIDTPGIHKARNKLGAAMTDMALNTFKEVDVILFLVDGSIKKDRETNTLSTCSKICRRRRFLSSTRSTPWVRKSTKEIFDEYDELGVFDGIFGTSALEGKNVPELMNKIETYMEEGPMFFPRRYGDRPSGTLHRQ